MWRQECVRVESDSQTRISPKKFAEGDGDAKSGVLSLAFIPIQGSICVILQCRRNWIRKQRSRRVVNSVA